MIFLLAFLTFLLLNLINMQHFLGISGCNRQHEGHSLSPGQEGKQHIRVIDSYQRIIFFKLLGTSVVSVNLNNSSLMINKEVFIMLIYQLLSFKLGSIHSRLFIDWQLFGINIFYYLTYILGNGYIYKLFKKLPFLSDLQIFQYFIRYRLFF